MEFFFKQPLVNWSWNSKHRRFRKQKCIRISYPKNVG
jgi:hypothetical protein